MYTQHPISRSLEGKRDQNLPCGTISPKKQLDACVLICICCVMPELGVSIGNNRDCDLQPWAAKHKGQTNPLNNLRPKIRLRLGLVDFARTRLRISSLRRPAVSSSFLAPVPGFWGGQSSMAGSMQTAHTTRSMHIHQISTHT